MLWLTSIPSLSSTPWLYVLSYLHQNNQTLKVLNLAYNGLANEGAVAIADALKVNSTLEELDIR